MGTKVITGLNNGTNYTFGVKTKSIDNVTYSSISTISATPKATPIPNGYTAVDQGNWASAQYALGAKLIGTDVVEFGLYSTKATKIMLEVYEEAFGADAVAEFWMEKGNDKIWRAKIQGLKKNGFYAYRVWGPNWPYNAAWKRGNSDAGFITDADGSHNRFNLIKSCMIRMRKIKP